MKRSGDAHLFWNVGADVGGACISIRSWRAVRRTRAEVFNRLTGRIRFALIPVRRSVATADRVPDIGTSARKRYANAHEITAAFAHVKFAEFARFTSKPGDTAANARTSL